MAEGDDKKPEGSEDHGAHAADDRAGEAAAPTPVAPVTPVNEPEKPVVPKEPEAPEAPEKPGLFDEPEKPANPLRMSAASDQTGPSATNAPPEKKSDAVKEAAPDNKTPQIGPTGDEPLTGGDDAAGEFVPEAPRPGPKPAPPSSIRKEMGVTAPADKASEEKKTGKKEVIKEEAAKERDEKKEAAQKETAQKGTAKKESEEEAKKPDGPAIERPTQAPPPRPSRKKREARKEKKEKPVREGMRRKRPSERRRERKLAKRERKENRGIVAKIFFGFVQAVSILIVLAGLGVAGYIALYVNRLNQDLPDYSALLEYEPPIMTRIHAGDGTLIAEYANERRLFVPIEQIPDHVINAFVAAEDQHFYDHPGIDLQGIARAAVSNISNYLNDRRLEGASTITQQVAKNFLLSSEVSIDRKVREQLLALRIEQTFSKDEILELYLNQIYLGWRSYGVAAAALNYFNKPLDELTLAEAAYLAVMPKAPNNYRPDRESTRARSLERRAYVLNRMAEDGYITRAAAREAMAEPLVIYERPAGAQVAEAAYFAEEARREIAREYGFDALLDGGLSVRTTIDMNLQRVARTALRNGLVAYDQRHGWRGPVVQLETIDDWRGQVDALELPRDLAPWEPAVVTRVDDELGQVVIELASEEESFGIIPFSELAWARVQAENGIDIGPEVQVPSEVLAAGDVIWVEPVEIEPEPATGDLLLEDEEGELLAEVVTFAHPTFGLRQVPGVNGGIIAMDPHTGRILAMVGGFSYDASEFNRATQAQRQPGSSFKPFVYAAALGAGHTPSDLILDAPFVMPQGEGLPLWRPDNYTDRFYGPSTLRSGVERSRNAMTVRLAQDIGMERVVDIAERFGVVDHLEPYLAYALGAGETTLERMVTAYSQFVNGGRRLEPFIVERVQDRYGRTLFSADARECENCNLETWDGAPAPALAEVRDRVLDPRTAYQVVSILEGAVQRGTGRSLRSVGVPLGGKTGTTNEERDAWFIGISPDLVVGAYVGFDTPLPMGQAETGGRVAAPIAREFFTETVGTRPPIPFRRPPGIRIVRVNAENGQLARPGDLNVIEEAFRPGSEPSGEGRVIGADGWTSQDEEDLRSGSGGLY